MDAYSKTSLPVGEGRVALWHNDTAITQSMATQPDTNISVKQSKANLAERYWMQRGTLFLPQRMRLNTVRAMAVKTEIPMLGGAWTPCKIKDTVADKDGTEKALCVYLNSSTGVLAMLGSRSSKALSYPNYSLDDLRKQLPVPDFAAIGANAAAELAAAYDAHANDILLPLSQMDDDLVRRALDAAVVSALGLDGELVATIRRQLAAEPSVTGQRYGQ